ncbi:hypothetical protein ACQUW5_03060 [Legionella sp. CNM-1927-20]|uniref:hypothetical protein n=1 Tax=Legionella sp. CNM-1927-20 TaxID=3422221 RepID=UPI00403AA796
MKVKYHIGNSPYISIQLSQDGSVYYHQACIITSESEASSYLKVDNDYELGKLYFEGTLKIPPLQQPVKYPLWLKISQTETACYPTVNNYDAISPRLTSGFFKPISGDQRLALRSHNIKNYKPSTKVLNLHNANLVDALESMADEIEEMTEKGIAFQR